MGRSSYPGQLDSDVELPYVADNITEIGAEAINSLRDAIFSIEEVIGVNPQGNMSTFIARINKVIDDNGIIKTSALAQKGLVTLPISNIHIGDTAAIKEYKLDLDYGTSELYGRIATNMADLEAIRVGLNSFIARSSKHFSGVGDRHKGSHIDLVAPVQGNTTVETALHTIDDNLTSHQNSSSAHTASNISVSNDFESFSATNVQTSLEALDQIGITTIVVHQDSLHTNGIALNEKGEQGDQGNLKETILASTIFQTETSKSTNILQVMRPNVARVTSKNINMGLLAVGSSNILRVQAGGVGRGPLDIDLSAIIPVDDLDILVVAINQTAQGCVSHYPISAYNTGGKLTIAHNIPGQDYTIEIQNVGFSAATTLGFGDVVSTVFYWSGNNHHGYVGGNQIKDFKTLVKVHYKHNKNPASLIAPGLGDLSELGIPIGNEGRVICNITNHSTTPTDNGTHYILAFPNRQSFFISADISFGEFDIEIVADSVNFQNNAQGKIYDIFVEYDNDGYGIVSKSDRITYGVINGVDLRAVNRYFPTSNVEWEVSGSNSIQLFENGIGGVVTNIPIGYQGPLKVFAPDNTNSAIFEVIGAPSNAKRDIAATNFSGSAEKMYVSSIHYAGNHGLYELRYVSDKRQLGCVPKSFTNDDFNLSVIEETLKGLRNNGVIRGLDVISSSPSSLYIRGGQVLVDGRIVNISTRTINVSAFGVSQRLLLVDKYGNFTIKSQFEAGYSYEELTDENSHGDNKNVAIIAEFETDGTEISGDIVDRRLMVNDIDKRLSTINTNLDQKIEQVLDTVGGSTWGFTVASSSIPGDGYLASIEVNHNNGFSYVPSGIGWWDQSPTSANGFIAGQSIITTRRFEFEDVDTAAISVFKAPGLTHINVFTEVTYSGANGGPFAVSGTVYIELGVAIEIGITNITESEEYARVKTVFAGVLPSNSVVERYVASIPVSQLGIANNVMFDVVPRVKIINSDKVDGSIGNDLEPIITFDNVRIVTSSYSIAGNINNQDGSNVPLAAIVGEVL